MDIETVRNAFQSRTPGTIGSHREFAVLVPFVGGKEPSILYEVRSQSIMQPGEVCFPGGHVEEGETPENCALRETIEELGIKEDSVRITARGDTLYGAGSFTLYTFIGEIDLSGGEAASGADKDAQDGAVSDIVLSDLLDPDPEEVAEVFTVPVKVLMDEEPRHYAEHLRPEIDPDFPYEEVGISRGYPWRTSDYDIPVYDIDGRIIWGLTARITERIVEILKGFAPEQGV